HGTWRFLCILPDFPHAWFIQGRQSDVDRGGGGGILVPVFLSCQYFVLFTLFQVRGMLRK
ncbi:MAG: hypothetical protein K2N94_10595, partial [Lachnospiraceae bacterium]|nr:hypothetical protein [Lachnospiraceae bacterium]